jgi:L-iditol 2-dehydrogenase
MKAVVKFEPGIRKVELREIPIPKPGKGEVLIKVMAAGVCGTDVHIYYDDGYKTHPPVVLGHEVSGVVESLGEGVENCAVGARVTTETYYYTCGVCPYCRTGRRNLCDSRLSIGSGVNGGFTSLLVVPEGNLHYLPDSVSFEHGALTEPVAVCAQAVFEKAKIIPHDNVVISGPGFIGLICLQLLKISGARCIVIGGPSDSRRLSLAERLGADVILQAGSEDLEKKVKDLCNKIGADAVIECSGSEAGINSGIRYIKKGGCFVQVGLSGKNISLDIDTLTLKEINLKGTFAQKWYWWGNAISLMSSGQLNVSPLISEMAPISSWKEVFENAAQQQGIKYLLKPL